jgi:hypothetical protein
LIYARDHEGSLAAAAMESNGADELITDRISGLMDAFIQEEQRLLVQRGLAADAGFRSTARLLGLASVLAFVFFVTGGLWVRRETGRRHRVEVELCKATESVKTLSGLLPMCAHCKSIRDDNGYWNRIEAYIQEHSEATFSHGMCENCLRLHYPDIADKVLKNVRKDPPPAG